MPSAAFSRGIAALEHGDAIGAARLLEGAAAAGDGAAALALAQLRLGGDYLRRDLALARHWFGRAAELGEPDAELAYTSLLANGAGQSGRHWTEALNRLANQAESDPSAQRELAVIHAMALDPHGEPRALPSPRRLSADPAIDTFDAFLTPDECGFLRDMALPHLQPAVVVDPRTGALIRDPIRTSRSAGFPFIAERPGLHAVNRRIAAATGTAYEQGEPTQILSYAPREEYKLHSDALPGADNQRVATFLILLDDDFAGGETIFPRLGLKWRGNIGDALWFRNVDAYGQPAPLAWHAGAPVTRGCKVMLSKWLRAQPLDLLGPSGKPL
jgi:prolyl 4-hydroxylase